MTKKEAIGIFGSQAELARFFGISKGAVSQWPEDKIPELRALQIQNNQKNKIKVNNAA